MPILDHFGLLAPFYDRVFEKMDHSTLEDCLALPAGGRLLDAGGGTGRVSQAFTEIASEIVVADESVKMLLEVVAKPALTPVRAHAEKLPFASDAFDGVIMVDALHHVANQRETLAEMWRVVKPGGRIVVEEPNIAKMVVKGLALIEKVALMRSHFLAPAEIADLLSFAGAEITIRHEGIISWVVAEKQAPSQAT